MRRSASRFSTNRSSSPYGFTLIEMAVVLIIIGIIAALTFPLVSEKLKQEKLSKGRGALISLKQEIIGFVQTNMFLPGEAAVESSFANARDAQQNYIAYYVDPNLKSGDICTKTSTNYALTIGGATYSNLAFIIASRGANQNLQINAASGGTPPTSRTVTSYTQGAQTDTVNANPPNTTQTYDLATLDATLQFDDLVDYVTLDALKGKICAGSAAATGEATGGAIDFKDILKDWPTVAKNSAQRTTGTVKTDPVGQQLLLGNQVTNTSACIWSDAVYPDANGNGIWDGVGTETTSFGNNDVLECRRIGNLAANAVYCQARDIPGGSTERWKNLAAVFKFSVLNADAAARNSDNYVAGVVFSLISADADGAGGPTNLAVDNMLNTIAPCYTGSTDSYEGYAGNAATIYTPKIGVEIDMARDSSQSDPDPQTDGVVCGKQDYANHVAAIFYNDGVPGSRNDDNAHNLSGAQIYNPPYVAEQSNPTVCADSSQAAARQDGFATNATAYSSGARNQQWLEDRAEHWIRVEIHRSLTAESGGSHNGRYKYSVYFWLDDTPNAAFLNVNMAAGGLSQNLANADHFEKVDVYLSSADHAKFHYFRLGWTMSFGSPSQTINLGQFAFNGTSGT